MNTPEIQSPEFSSRPLEYLPGDEVPETVVDLLALCVRDAGEAILQSVEVYNDWASRHSDRPPGSLVSERGVDEPSVGHFRMNLRGVSLPGGASAYTLWVLQRGLDWFSGLEQSDQRACEELMETCGGRALLSARFTRRLTRVENKLALG